MIRHIICLETESTPEMLCHFHLTFSTDKEKEQENRKREQEK